MKKNTLALLTLLTAVSTASMITMAYADDTDTSTSTAAQPNNTSPANTAPEGTASSTGTCGDGSTCKCPANSPSSSDASSEASPTNATGSTDE